MSTSQPGSSLSQPVTLDFALRHNVNIRGLEDIPLELLDLVCENIHVEFVPPLTRPELVVNTPNYVHIKVDFTQPPELNGAGELAGVSIGMWPVLAYPITLDSGFNSYVCGRLRVILLPYKGPSRESFRTFTSRPLIPTLTLHRVLRVLTENELHFFDFDYRSGVLRGWRDFVYQVFFQLASRGYVDHSFDDTWPGHQLRSGEATIEAVLGKRYYLAEDARVVPICKGRFYSYQRANEELPPYQPRR
ncbi:hypothetical protein K449DRAFT_425362 [Hypoxylon sp. EC38]|nr:hypothetical protein K449DRAFT_425362 [Hypoxylon sp. EC38]